MLAKIRAPGESFDLVFPGPSVLSKMVYTELLQPLNHTYVPNLDNVWPEYQDPWYDRARATPCPTPSTARACCTAPTGCPSVPENGYDLLWDEQYAGKTYLLDDHERGHRHVAAPQRHHHGHQHQQPRVRQARPPTRSSS